MLDATKMIADEFKSTVFKAVERYAKRYGVDSEAIRIDFSLDPSGEVLYKIFVARVGNMEFKEHVSFKDLLDVKIDILQKSKKIPPIIQVTLLTLNDEKGMDECSARIIMCKYQVTGKDNKKEYILRMCLYDKNVYKEDVSFGKIIEILTNLSAA
jgi:hypothetical protein